MKPYRLHIIALIIVTMWGIFSYAYMGVEDGSSGLSILGWINVVFFAPGVILVYQLKGSHSNADILLSAATSWLIYSLLALVIIYATYLICRILNKNTNHP
jgi:hypothetical protein